MKKAKSSFITLLSKYKKGILAVAILIIFLIAIFPVYGIYNAIKPAQELASSDPYEGCNALGIELRGDLYTYIPTDKDGNNVEGYEDSSDSEKALFLISEAEYSDKIKAIVIEVDSYGGFPSAGEEIAEGIKLANKPVIAFIRSAGVSAAYYAITPADRIFALKNSDIGSIGVTQSYLNNVSKNEKEGYSFVQLSVGKFKDSGSGDKELTDEERNLFMRDLEVIHENFIKAVSENRNIAIEKVRELADGSSVLGEQALALGLIDEIGTYDNVVSYLEKTIGEEPNICW